MKKKLYFYQVGYVIANRRFDLVVIAESEVEAYSVAYDDLIHSLHFMERFKIVSIKKLMYRYE